MIATTSEVLTMGATFLSSWWLFLALWLQYSISVLPMSIPISKLFQNIFEIATRIKKQETKIII
jgi:hypothetical protein